MALITDRPYILQASLEMASIPISEAEKVDASGYETFVYRKQRKLAKRGGLGDVVTSLAISLHSQGANVGVALPHWKVLFDKELAEEVRRESEELVNAGIDWGKHLFLIDDRVFEQAGNIEDIYGENKGLQSLAFQRRVLNNIIPRVNPAIIQTHDWSTGLINPLAHPGIQTLHTVHNTHSFSKTLEELTRSGLTLWGADRLYKDHPHGQLVDFQMSGIYGSKYIALVSNGWLEEVIQGKGANHASQGFHHEILQKYNLGRARGILNAPDSSYMPEIDPALPINFSNNSEMPSAKRENKIKFQFSVGLKVDSSAPLIVWNNRLDEHQKGPQLLDEALPHILFENPSLQFAIVADGPYAPKLKERIEGFPEKLRDRVVLHPFSDYFERFGYGAADALINCSLYAPCEMVQLKGPKYGVVPIVRGVGGLKDSVFPINGDDGNGIVFNDYDSNALRWGISEFMRLFSNSETFYTIQSRIKSYADKNFSVERMAKEYINYYEHILGKSVTE